MSWSPSLYKISRIRGVYVLLLCAESQFLAFYSPYLRYRELPLWESCSHLEYIFVSLNLRTREMFSPVM